MANAKTTRQPRTGPKKSGTLTVGEPAAARATRRLSDTERAVLDEAVTRSAAVISAIDTSWAELGRWLFTRVFGEDSTSAIEHRRDNPVWVALYALADGAKVRARHDELERALLAAAYDKRLNHDAWRALDFGRKWRLLKIADDKLLRKAAQHVLATNLDTRGVEAYVRAVLEESATPVAVRVNVPALVGALDRMQERLTDRAFGRQLEKAARQLSDEKREALVASITQTRDALDAMLGRLDD